MYIYIYIKGFVSCHRPLALDDPISDDSMDDLRAHLFICFCRPRTHPGYGLDSEEAWRPQNGLDGTQAPAGALLTRIHGFR